MAKTKGHSPSPLVGVIMGSQSDWRVMRYASEQLDELGVAHEVKIVSAHRTPERMYTYAKEAKDRGLKVIIAGAGGAAHLPGMTASLTILPVLGVPIDATKFDGLDSLMSIVQMPGGVPVGTLAVGKSGAVNAALLATSIIALSDPSLARRLSQWRAERTDSVADAPVDDPKSES
jgi:5-(carboxyamino)imidazole ribonucleotide mutase